MLSIGHSDERLFTRLSLAGRVKSCISSVRPRWRLKWLKLLSQWPSHTGGHLRRIGHFVNMKMVYHIPVILSIQVQNVSIPIRNPSEIPESWNNTDRYYLPVTTRLARVCLIVLRVVYYSCYRLQSKSNCSLHDAHLGAISKITKGPPSYTVCLLLVSIYGCRPATSSMHLQVAVLPQPQKISKPNSSRHCFGLSVGRKMTISRLWRWFGWTSIVKRMRLLQSRSVCDYLKRVGVQPSVISATGQNYFTLSSPLSYWSEVSGYHICERNHN